MQAKQVPTTLLVPRNCTRANGARRVLRVKLPLSRRPVSLSLSQGKEGVCHWPGAAAPGSSGSRMPAHARRLYRSSQSWLFFCCRLPAPIALWWRVFVGSCREGLILSALGRLLGHGGAVGVSLHIPLAAHAMRPAPLCIPSKRPTATRTAARKADAHPHEAEHKAGREQHQHRRQQAADRREEDRAVAKAAKEGHAKAAEAERRRRDDGRVVVHDGRRARGEAAGFVWGAWCLCGGGACERVQRKSANAAEAQTQRGAAARSRRSTRGVARGVSFARNNPPSSITQAQSTLTC